MDCNTLEHVTIPNGLQRSQDVKYEYNAIGMNIE